MIDTSILARLANMADAQFATADRAVMELHHRGELLCITPQNLIEFRNLATRPKEVNGLVFRGQTHLELVPMLL